MIEHLESGLARELFWTSRMIDRFAVQAAVFDEGFVAVQTGNDDSGEVHIRGITFQRCGVAARPRRGTFNAPGGSPAGAW
jgi:hypothetical protein